VDESSERLDCTYTRSSSHVTRHGAPNTGMPLLGERTSTLPTRAFAGQCISRPG